MAMEVVAAIVVAAEEVDDVTRMQLTSTSVIESRSPILVVACYLVAISDVSSVSRVLVWNEQT
jgi:hypothetical protein